MNTEETLKIKSTSSEQTEQIGERFSSLILKPGSVVELISDLGGGKTTFAKGLARGLGYKADVLSPSFTISRLYKSPVCDIYHYDFYRLVDAGIIKNELEESISDPSAVNVIEWADVVADILPSDKLTVKIEFVPKLADARQIIFNGPPTLINKLKNKLQ